MTSWHRSWEPLASVVILLVFIPPIKHRKGKNLEPASAEGGGGGRQNHGMSVCLMGTVGWDRCLSRETLGQLLSPTRHAAGASHGSWEREWCVSVCLLFNAIAA